MHVKVHAEERKNTAPALPEMRCIHTIYTKYIQSVNRCTVATAVVALF